MLFQVDFFKRDQAVGSIAKMLFQACLIFDMLLLGIIHFGHAF